MSTGTPRTIFYSWQADYPHGVNRSFIEEAMDRAVKTLKRDETIFAPDRGELVVDQATKGVPGSPAIAATILQKIDECAIFVADITSLGTVGPQGRSVPNPNVVFELGYAWKHLQEQRILVVLNTAFSPNPKNPEHDLPFDIRGNRFIAYHLKPGDAKKETRDRLVGVFAEAFKTILPTLAPEVPPRPRLNVQSWIDPSGGRIVYQKAFLVDTDGDGFEEPLLALGRRTSQHRPVLDLLVARFSGGGWGRITVEPIPLVNDPTLIWISTHRLTGERHNDLVVGYNTGGTWSGQVILQDQPEARSYSLAPREIGNLQGPLGIDRFVWTVHYRSQITFRPRLDAPSEEIVEELRFQGLQAAPEPSLATYVAEHPSLDSLRVYRTWRWNERALQFDLRTQEIPLDQ